MARTSPGVRYCWPVATDPERRRWPFSPLLHGAVVETGLGQCVHGRVSVELFLVHLNFSGLAFEIDLDIRYTR